MAGRTPPEPRRPFALDFAPLRKMRKYHEISQQELARAAGVHWTTILRLENNATANPSLLPVLAIARSLGVPIYDLFTVTDERK
jgi:DNA-binding XRE family transcriptional regulator